jgi:hypothetical protein
VANVELILDSTSLVANRKGPNLRDTSWQARERDASPHWNSVWFVEACPVIACRGRHPLVSAAVVAGRAAPDPGRAAGGGWGQPLFRPAPSFAETGTSNRPSAW